MKTRPTDIYFKGENKINKFITPILILTCFLAIIFLNGCKPKESIQSSNTTQRNDSIVTVIIKDTVIKYLPQTQTVKTNQKSKLSTDFAFSLASIDEKGLLNHSIENYPKVPAKIIIKTSTVNHYRNTEINKTNYITKTITITKYKYKRDAIWYIGLVCSLLVFGFVGFKIYKKVKI